MPGSSKRKNAKQAAQMRRRSHTKKAVKNWKPNLGDIHRPLVTISVVLFFFGLMMIASSSLILANESGLPPFQFAGLQIIWLIVGGIIAAVIYAMPLEFFGKASIIALVIAIISLILVLFLGTNTLGARRWIDLGPFNFQPSEVAKLAFVLYLSAWLARPQKVYKDFKRQLESHFLYQLLPFVILLGIISVLIVLQPDLDTAVIIGVTALVIYFVSGQDTIHLIGTSMIVLVAILVAIFAAVAEPYRLERVQTYVSFIQNGEFSVRDQQDSAFQIHHGLVAIAEGGILGKGYGQSRGKLFYLSNAAFTDSIYAVVAEEFGLLGSLGLISAFLYFMSIGVNIARNAHDQYASLLAVGITTWITVQAFLNMGANLAVIPFGGIPLPFLSYGGSGTLITMAGIGLLLNIHRRSQGSVREN